MLDHEDLKWIATTSTNLNSMLQQIARYSDLVRRHQGNYNYIDLLGERVELASKTAQALFDRVTSNILEQTAVRTAARRKTPMAPFTVLPPPGGAVTPAMPAATDLSKLTPQPSQTTRDKGAAAVATAPLAADLKVKNSQGNRELILLIEDEHEVADMAAEMLAEEGYKVILAGDGFEALKIYERIGTQIGLVILDYFLPVMDGDAVFDELRELNPSVNVVLSSGFAEQQKVSAMLGQGLRGFMPKPYTREKLLSQVRSALDAARQR
jgi:CheY-like chemotaxis protein